MKLTAAAKIEGVVSTAKGRDVLRNVVLRIDQPATVGDDGQPIPGKGRLFATDGAMMAIIPVETNEHDVFGVITPESLAMARKLAGKRGEIDMTANGSLAIANGPAYPRPDKDLAGTWTSDQTLSQVVPNVDVGIRVCLDAVKLAKLAAALGKEKVYLTFDSANPSETVIRVDVSRDAGCAWGLLAPCRVE